MVGCRCMDADAREQMRQWIENWTRVGPILEEECARLRNLSDREAQQAVQDLLSLWQPDWDGDDGQGLLLPQQVFERGRVFARLRHSSN